MQCSKHPTSCFFTHTGEHFGEDTNAVSVRQTRRGCFQEMLGCEARTEFKWFNITVKKTSSLLPLLRNPTVVCVPFCGGCHEFTMVVKEEGSGVEVLSMHRPMSCNAGPCKCCCFQEMTMSSNGRTLGKVEEKFYCCVPRMLIKIANGVDIYKVHQPTCCGGMCVKCFTEGNPCCGKGCCREPFHIFPADQIDTDNGAAHVGNILKLPKSMMTELCTDSEAYAVTFPEKSTTEQKALIAGSSVFINASFFEQGNEGGVIGMLI